MKNNLLIFIPTYNEKENIENLYLAIKRLAIPMDVLFLDDNSPDGTGNLLDKISKNDESVHVIHRLKKMGIGSAHIEAFKYANEKNYKFLLTMDADFTHDPKYIPTIFEKKEINDVVIGSRYTNHGKIEGWSFYRRLMTKTAHFLTKYALNLPYDCTGAYRLYKVSILKPDFYQQIKSNGYSFFIESLYKLNKNKCVISEIPIVAMDRNKGKSKISKKEIIKAISKLIILSTDRFNLKLKNLLTRTKS